MTALPDRPEPSTEGCPNPEPCDSDCEIGPVHCPNLHLPRHKWHAHPAEIDVTRRLDQIEQTALRVRPTDVGKWAMATGKPSAASAVVIAPADLYWLLAMVRATRVPSPGGGRS